MPPREVHQAQVKAGATQKTEAWQARYAVRAGVEGTINPAVDLAIRRARYRDIAKTRLQHVFIACAINMIRLDAYWNGHVLDRTRTGHLGRLEPTLATSQSRPQSAARVQVRDGGLRGAAMLWR